MKEMVFDFKKSNTPWILEDNEWHTKEQQIKSSIDRIINDVNDPKENRTDGASGSSGRPIQIERKIVDSTDINEKTVRLQEDYLEYLEMAYESDNGIVIKPDFIWFTILCEMAKEINSNPETFRKYYTTAKEGKTLIVLPSSCSNIGVPELPLNIATEEVLKRVPSNLTEDLIVPNFSTLTERSELAFKCSFIESISPYYEFGMVGCGYSRIKVLGTQKDYKLMITTLNKISKIIPEFKDYFKHCIEAIDDIIKEWNNKYFWKNICWTDHGYARHDVDGWFIKFFRNYDGKAKSQHAFPKHIAKVEYSHDGDHYIMYMGLFDSTYEDDCYVADFTKIITKKVS